jgi:hypothetical protein
MLDTPVLLLIFNRPQQTKLVFDEIKKQKPKYLHVAADGPRANNLEDHSLCLAARNIVNEIDWDCKIETLFRSENLGSKNAVSTAITWFFSVHEFGIILEDDCLPNASFFLFTKTLLERYKDEKKVMMITGCSFQQNKFDQNSYYFSKYVHVWGWATWKRAWDLYNVSLENEPDEVKHAVIKKTFRSKREQKLWRYNLNLISNGLDAWDYQWMYWIWKNKGLTIIPWQNMISNIGFGPNATHTFDRSSHQSEMKQFHLTEINHPKEIKANRKADKFERFTILINPFFKVVMAQIISKTKRLISSFK